MSDLPSREMVRHVDNIHDFPRYLQYVLLPLALAWQSGRLVDREAINYEAAEAFARKFVRPQSPFLGAPTLGWGATVKEIVNAAIGDGDD